MTAGPTADSSLVLGGPLYQLYRRARLSTDTLDLLYRRILAVALFAWLPLAFLSVLGGEALGGTKISFLKDIEAHVRFLVALPALMLAELVVHRRFGPLMRRFVERRIVTTEDEPTFNAAIDSALRVRNSVAVEIALVIVVYTLGLWVWRNQIAQNEPTWYAGAGLNYTWAGYWYVFVSIPIFQFMLLRWYVRIALWFWVLWRVSKLNLHLMAAHPDRTGGIGFIGGSAYALTPFLFAQGALLAGLIANRVLYEGQTLMSFKMDAAALIGFFVLFALGPLTVFTPQLMRAKRKGKAEYAGLASRYVFGFEEKWLRGGAREIHELLGAPDIQSLADLADSYAVVKDMRIVPFSIHDVTQLVAATAVPLLPLTLTAFSLEEVLTRLIKIML
jgi:hypothetical protein